jgi:hypothetical protein
MPQLVCDIGHSHRVTSNLVLHSTVASILGERTPPARRPSQKAPGFLRLSLGAGCKKAFYKARVRIIARPGDLDHQLLTALAVFAPEKQKRLALADYHILDFRNKDGVVPGILRRLQPAFQVGQGPV